jgi:hypothetical protein
MIKRRSEKGGKMRRKEDNRRKGMKRKMEGKIKRTQMIKRRSE